MRHYNRHDAALHIALFASLAILVYMSVFYVSLPYGVQGWHAPTAFRTFFYHIPVAWTAYVSFGVVFVASIFHLRTRAQKWDMVAGGSAEIGIVMTSLALLTGAVWSKAEQGYYWTWDDPKLFATFILWIAYVAYLTLRAGVKGEAKARICAVFGTISFVFVPLSYIASKSEQSLHPDLTRSASFFPVQNGITLLVGVVAFTLLYLSLFKLRYGVEKLTAQLEVVKDEMEEPH